MVMFTPTDNMMGLRVPYLEEARADFAPYYRTGKTESAIQTEIITELAKLGGGSIQFRRGFFGAKSAKRHGYIINFTLGGQPARMEVAGLPIRDAETQKKIEQVCVQALCNVRDWIKAAVTAQVFAPGSNPLIQYLLVDKDRTLAQALIEDRQIPNTNPMLESGE